MNISGITVARCKTYELLSRLTAFPDRQAVEQVKRNENDFFGKLVEYEAMLPYKFIPETVKFDFLEMDFDTLNEGYVSLFELSAGGNLVRLFEGEMCENRTRTMKDLSRIYEFFGLVYECGGDGEALDHLPVELSFMHYLAFKEVEYADEQEDQSSFILGQRDFLDKHLSRWTPILCEGMSEFVRVPSGKNTGVINFYKNVFELTNEFVTGDLRYLEERISTWEKR